MVVETWRKKSLPNLEVQVVRVNADNAEEVAAWCGASVVEEINPFDHENRTPGLNVPTDLGRTRASVGDYILQIGSGDFRVRKPNAFRSLWEPKK